MKKFLESKWASRKLWTLIGTALFVILTDILGVQIDQETYWAIVALAVSFITGQAFVDGKEKQAEAEKAKKETEINIEK
jgi:hypothetical protein